MKHSNREGETILWAWWLENKLRPVPTGVTTGSIRRRSALDGWRYSHAQIMSRLKRLEQEGKLTSIRTGVPYRWALKERG